MISIDKWGRVPVRIWRHRSGMRWKPRDDWAAYSNLEDKHLIPDMSAKILAVVTHTVEYEDMHICHTHHQGLVGSLPSSWGGVWLSACPSSRLQRCKACTIGFLHKGHGQALHCSDCVGGKNEVVDYFFYSKCLAVAILLSTTYVFQRVSLILQKIAFVSSKQCIKSIH